MSIEILDMCPRAADGRAIDIALPVLAIECEAATPVGNELDAYEEAALSLVALGLSAHGIAGALCATESLAGKILSGLKSKQFAVREKGKPWELTQKGENYLNGIAEEESASSSTQYGYMFVNAIKKEVLPFFYQGDVGKISSFRGSSLPLKMTVEGDEKKTFVPLKVKQFALKKAYHSFYRCLEAAEEYKEGEITKEEAIDRFADLDSFDETIEEEEIAPAGGRPSNQGKNAFIRMSGKPPKRFYLRMRIILDPAYPGGYRAESPFDLRGIDDGYFLRQIRWLEQSGGVHLGEEDFQQFLKREICKWIPSVPAGKEDFQVFLMKKMPLLKMLRSSFPSVYEDMERIHSLMQRQSGLLDQENVVNNLARSVVESLFNAYFRRIAPGVLEQVSQRAFDDAAACGAELYKKSICRNAGLREDALAKVEEQYLYNILRKLTKTYGNSITEKFVNMLVVAYYGIGSQRIDRFLAQPDLNGKYSLIHRLNRIRRKVSHDTDERFTADDYDFYMAHVFGMVNRLLEPFGEEL